MQIQKLREEVQRRNRISAKLDECYIQQNELQKDEERLRTIRTKEQKDVERLSGGSLAAFFYGVIGKQAEVLDREQREAYEAAVKHDTVAGDLYMVNDEIRRLEEELRFLDGIEHKLERAIHEKKEHLKANCPQEAQAILDREEQIATLRGQQREMKEALVAGKDAAQTANEIRESLNSAERWGNVDMLGGGLGTTMIKHSHLEKAQDKINLLQHRLRTFRTELVDISFSDDIQLQVDGFLRFADYFWDGIFSDWMVQGRIHKAQSQVDEVILKVKGIVTRLQKMENETQQQLVVEQECLESLVEHAAGETAGGN